MLYFLEMYFWIIDQEQKRAFLCRLGTKASLAFSGGGKAVFGDNPYFI